MLSWILAQPPIITPAQSWRDLLFRLLPLAIVIAALFLAAQAYTAAVSHKDAALLYALPVPAALIWRLANYAGKLPGVVLYRAGWLVLATVCLVGFLVQILCLRRQKGRIPVSLCIVGGLLLLLTLAAGTWMAARLH